MKRLLLLLAVGMAATTNTACGSSTSTAVDLTGPAAKYRVRLSGAFGAPYLPDRLNAVTAAVTGKDRVEASPFEVYSSDFMDRGFVEHFSAAVWPTENAVQWLAATQAKSRAVSTIEVANESGIEIPVLQIDANDLILVFRVTPGARQSFNVMWTPDWPPCISVKWRGLDGRVEQKRDQCFARKPGIETMSFRVLLDPTRIDVEAQY